MAVINSPNMNLPIPAVGTEAGPLYAADINGSLTIVDQHNHSAGQGVQITPDGLNINAALSFGNNIAIDIAALTLFPNAQSTINTVYETAAGDLHYINSSGLDIQITNGTGVAVTPTSIPGLVAPASASYVPGSSTFVWQSNTSIAANMDFGAAIMRNLSPNSTFSLTLQPPTLTSNYTITLPALPPSTSLMALDSSGNISAPYSISGGLNASVLTPNSITATQIANNVITFQQIANNTITSTQIADQTILNSKLAPVNIAFSSVITFNVTATTLTNVTGLTVTLTGCVNSRPIMVMIQAGPTNASSFIQINSVGVMAMGCVTSTSSGAAVHLWAGSSNAVQAWSPTMYSFIDPAPAVGTNTYQIQARMPSGSVFSFNSVQLVAYEL